MRRIPVILALALIGCPDGETGAKGDIGADAEDGATIDVDNPSKAEIIGTVPRREEADTLQAIAAADNALPAWRAKTAGERPVLLYAWYNLMMEHQDDLGALMTLDQR